MERGFVYVHTPIITGSDCEGAGEMFRVTTLEPGESDFTEDFFGKMASLTVSGQLSAETFASAFRDVYTFGPTFRAENSNTTRHAAEFWILEPEIAFADINNNMDLAEDMLKYVIKYMLEHASDEMEFFDRFIENGLLERLNKVVNSEFSRITYTEAINIMEKTGEKFEYPTNWGVALQTEHERFLSEKVFMKPVFVIDYPKEIKSFYMRRNDDGKTVTAMDLLVPGIGEIIGGSQREERLDVLEAVIKELNLDMSDYWWYLELRKYGTVRHAGFGLGFERMLMYITGITNIRDVIPFPRTVNNLAF
jgi:asparaginyl-tRNA synthetase